VVKGLGLGFYYVKQIVEAHDGTITIQSAPGKGTTFHIKIPTKGGPPESRNSLNSSSKSKTRWSKEKRSWKSYGDKKGCGLHLKDQLPHPSVEDI